ncbi:MAG: ATP-binding protein [Terriglobales bacterium]
MSTNNIVRDGLDFSPFAWDTLTRDTHEVQFYTDDSFLLDSVSRFICEALGRGDAAVVIATAAHRNGLAKRMKARGVEPGVAVAHGRFVERDAAETLATFMVDTHPDPARFAEVIGGLLTRARSAAGSEQASIAIFGEMVALLFSAGLTEAAIELEKLWNGLARTHAFALRCAYPINSFSEEQHGENLLQLCAEHRHVIPAEGYSALAGREDRLLAIAYLQQRALALEAVIEERERLVREAQDEIARRRRAERALKERIADLKRAHAALMDAEKIAATGRLAATIAHELNNPLEAITNLFYLLNNDASLSAEGRSYAKLCEQQLERVAHIVKQTLGFYRSSEGPAPLSVAQLLRDALLLNAKRFELHGIKVEQEIGGNCHILAHDGEMRQVILNLIGNAIQAMTQGGKLRVRVRAGVDWKNCSTEGVHITIADTGNGINHEHRARIFEPFFSTKAKKGTGLGLWVTKGIVQKHHGSIRFRSRSGERHGTCFTVFLPTQPVQIGKQGPTGPRAG